uniref:Uncharacterized protein n=1 Tax=Siphoviridae sp. ctBCr48 TaxID=2827802 RepID=A0A8S5SHA9_9CAUD|nr:MAG TPA: hypothetical protein [Siphoviridae sp. ctBCr48]
MHHLFRRRFRDLFFPHLALVHALIPFSLDLAHPPCHSPIPFLCSSSLLFNLFSDPRINGKGQGE